MKKRKKIVRYIPSILWVIINAALSYNAYTATHFGLIFKIGAGVLSLFFPLALCVQHYIILWLLDDDLEEE